jgi:hypothetical protein
MTYERIEVDWIYAHLVWAYVFSIYVITIGFYIWTVLKEFRGRNVRKR